MWMRWSRTSIRRWSLRCRCRRGGPAAGKTPMPRRRAWRRDFAKARVAACFTLARASTFRAADHERLAPSLSRSRLVALCCGQRPAPSRRRQWQRRRWRRRRRAKVGGRTATEYAAKALEDERPPAELAELLAGLARTRADGAAARRARRPVWARRPYFEPRAAARGSRRCGWRWPATGR